MKTQAFICLIHQICFQCWAEFLHNFPCYKVHVSCSFTFRSSGFHMHIVLVVFCCVINYSKTRRLWTGIHTCRCAVSVGQEFRARVLVEQFWLKPFLRLQFECVVAEVASTSHTQDWRILSQDGSCTCTARWCGHGQEASLRISHRASLHNCLGVLMMWHHQLLLETRS